MNVKKIQEERNELVLLVTGVQPQFVNAIRRTIMNAVPTLAIEDISIYRNDSVIFDEYLASRLGSIPLKTNKTYKMGDKVKLTLHAKGPKTVTAADIEAKDPSVETVGKEMPITKLKEGQELKLEMTAVMDSGNKNVKWQPAIATYNELPEIKNNGKAKNPQKVVDSCPKKVLETKAGKIVLKNPYGCSLCGYCEEASENQVEIVTNPSSFVLRVESHGQMPSKDIITQATDIIKNRCADFQSALAKIK